MKLNNAKSLMGATLAAGLLATIALLPQARGELVNENSRQEDRETMRQVLGTSQKAQATVQATEPTVPVTEVIVRSPVEKAKTQPAEPAPIPMTPAPVAAPAPVAVAPAPVVQQIQAIAPAPVAPAAVQAIQPVEVQNLSKSELLRRERVREELRNEDLLQERLEALRLRDEKKRVEEVLPGTKPNEVVQAPVQTLPVKEETVVAPITEKPVQANANVAAQAGKEQVIRDQVSMSNAAPINQLTTDENKVVLSISPRAGLSGFGGSTGMDIKGRYSGGIGAGVGVSDNLTFEIGYMYSEYGVASANPLLSSGIYYPYGTNVASETYAMKQNVGDAGLKLFFLGPDAKLRPFIGGGAAYSKSFINFDGRILAVQRQMGLNPAADYEVQSFLGYLSAGFDVRVSKNISIGTMFKYYTVLSARENQPLYNWSFYNPAGYSSYVPVYSANGVYDEKQVVGGTLARAAFYSVLGGVTFSF
jgi:hypothetical protein